MKKLILAATHAGCLKLGFALGIYLLPILTQPESPDIAVIEESLKRRPIGGRRSIATERIATLSIGAKASSGSTRTR